MCNVQIVIRLAETSDIEFISEILQAEGKMWDKESIAANLYNFYVLAYQDKVIGVLYGTVNTNKAEISWVAVHPMFPESSIRIAMCQALYGVLEHKPCICERRCNQGSNFKTALNVGTKDKVRSKR